MINFLIESNPVKMFLSTIETINIFDIKVGKLTYEKFSDIISQGIFENKRLTIGYANAATLNKIYSNRKLKDIFNSLDLIHPDGMGIYLASKFLYRDDSLAKRITGSDFYQFLIEESVKNKWRIFFFGHYNNTLKKIVELHPGLNVCGLQEGYKYESSEVVKKINESFPDIIIIGLSTPIQERWIIENKDKIYFKVILAVGEGIKIFAGEKIRGPVFLRKIGLEWLTRYFTNPVANFGKYIIGVPLFIIRVLKEKLKPY